MADKMQQTPVKSSALKMLVDAMTATDKQFNTPQVRAQLMAELQSAPVLMHVLMRGMQPTNAPQMADGGAVYANPDAMRLALAQQQRPQEPTISNEQLGRMAMMRSLIGA